MSGLSVSFGQNANSHSVKYFTNNARRHGPVVRAVACEARSKRTRVRFRLIPNGFLYLLGHKEEGIMDPDKISCVILSIHVIELL